MFRVFCIYIILNFFLPPCLAQSNPKKEYRQNFKRIQIKHADLLTFDKSKSDAQILKGNVWCEHEGASLYCDSAYLKGSKTLDAFGNIRIMKGDSLSAMAKEMHYDAASRIAQLSGSVICLGKNMRMETPALYFDTKRNIAGYFNHATIFNGQTVLKSKHGHYEAATEMLYFHYDVDINDPEFRLKSDTLKYHLPKKIAYFLGPSVIFNDSDYIYCENGYYDIKNQFSAYGKKSVVHSKNIELRGDSLYYDHNNHFGRSFKNVRITDTAQNSNLYGSSAYYDAKGPRFWITGKTLFSRKEGADSLHLHADTIYYASKDSINRYVSARRKVKIFHPRYQCISDSMHALSKDSVLRLFGRPMIWFGKMQCISDSISIFLSDSGIRKVLLEPKIFIVEKIDSSDKKPYFNQISGKKALIHFKNDYPEICEVKGETDLIYFIKENKKISGFTRTRTGDAVLFFTGGKFSRTKAKGKTKGSTYPIRDFNESNAMLPVFRWNPEHRPLSKFDLFKK